jgi:hypothetical protein
LHNFGAYVAGNSDMRRCEHVAKYILNKSVQSKRSCSVHLFSADTRPHHNNLVAAPKAGSKTNPSSAITSWTALPKMGLDLLRLEGIFVGLLGGAVNEQPDPVPEDRSRLDGYSCGIIGRRVQWRSVVSPIRFKHN